MEDTGSGSGYPAVPTESNADTPSEPYVAASTKLTDGTFDGPDSYNADGVYPTGWTHKKTQEEIEQDTRRAEARVSNADAYKKAYAAADAEEEAVGDEHTAAADDDVGDELFFTAEILPAFMRFELFNRGQCAFHPGRDHMGHSGSIVSVPSSRSQQWLTWVAQQSNYAKGRAPEVTAFDAQVSGSPRRLLFRTGGSRFGLQRPLIRRRAARWSQFLPQRLRLGLPRLG